MVTSDLFAIANLVIHVNYYEQSNFDVTSEGNP